VLTGLGGSAASVQAERELRPP